MATNVLRHHWRSQRRHASALERVRNTASLAHDGHEDEAIARVDALRELREASAAIRGLPRRELEALSLVAWGELTYQEAAVALGIPIGTVRSRISRARARLGDVLPAHSSTCVSAEGPLQ